MNPSQSWMTLPNCRRKKYTNKKMDVRKLIKKSKLQHYHEALKNARANPKEAWNLLKQLVPGISNKTNAIFSIPPLAQALLITFLQQQGRKRT